MKKLHYNRYIIDFTPRSFHEVIILRSDDDRYSSYNNNKLVSCDRRFVINSYKDSGLMAKDPHSLSLVSVMTYSNLFRWVFKRNGIEQPALSIRIRLFK